MNITSVNGIRSQSVSVIDRGLHYGDGVFETVKCTDRQLHYWKQHFERLSHSAEKLGIKCPQESVLLADISALIDTEHHDCVIKIIITRGLSERGYRYPKNIKPTRIVQLGQLPRYEPKLLDDGIMTTICEHRLSTNTQLAGIKHLNRLDNVIARNSIHNRYMEAIMLDQQDNVIEGTMSNLFIVKHGAICTADLTHCGVDGIIRNQIITLAKTDNIPIEITHIDRQQLFDADGCFFSNSLIDIWPVRSLEDGTDKHQFGSHEITYRLIELLHQTQQEHVTHV